MLHEIGHILGIGPAAWQELLVGAGGSDLGPRARQGFRWMDLRGYRGNIVPLENEGGAGTRDTHWRWRVFTEQQSSELMTALVCVVTTDGQTTTRSAL